MLAALGEEAVSPVLLVNGPIVGGWRHTRKGRRLLVAIRALRRVAGMGSYATQRRGRATASVSRLSARAPLTALSGRAARSRRSCASTPPRRDELARTIALEDAKRVETAGLEVERAAFTFRVAASVDSVCDPVEDLARRQDGSLRSSRTPPPRARSPIRSPRPCTAHEGNERAVVRGPNLVGRTCLDRRAAENDPVRVLWSSPSLARSPRAQTRSVAREGASRLTSQKSLKPSNTLPISRRPSCGPTIW